MPGKNEDCHTHIHDDCHHHGYVSTETDDDTDDDDGALAPPCGPNFHSHVQPPSLLLLPDDHDGHENCDSSDNDGKDNDDKYDNDMLKLLQ